MPSEEISPEIYKEIDENLRRAYEELLNEELPNRFNDLIQQLRERDKNVAIALAEGDSS